ncbi:MAG: fasciclin domain-containing protein, partial [Anaerolineae bacterium]|nr:fasciclin domain-containing protein [Anaerolineae bacterium]
LIPEGLMEMVAATTAKTETPTETVADLTAADENFSTLVSAIGEIAEAHPEVVGLISDPALQVTVFAPTNDAFGTLSEEALSAVQANTDLLAVLLSYHVVPGIFTADGLTALGNSIEGGTFNVMTAAGLPVTVTVSDEGINVGGAMVTGTNMTAANGIIHTIDTVILLPVE